MKVRKRNKFPIYISCIGCQELADMQKDAKEYFHAFAKFRVQLRQILYDAGVSNNPGWSEENIVDAFRRLLKPKPKRKARK